MNIYYEGRLFLSSFCFDCHVEISPSYGAFSHTIITIGKPLMNRVALGWFHNISTYDGKVIEY
jgi:hypothetical protein